MHDQHMSGWNQCRKHLASRMSLVNAIATKQPFVPHRQLPVLPSQQRIITLLPFSLQIDCKSLLSYHHRGSIFTANTDCKSFLSHRHSASIFTAILSI
eukprot:1139419-Pelagomonas_calceolata.AAC.14